jgi:predicted sugar kinase
MKEQIEETFRRLNCLLTDVFGATQNIRVIGESLPTTPLEDSDAICPELLFPALAAGVQEDINKAMSIVEELQTLCKKKAGQ